MKLLSPLALLWLAACSNGEVSELPSVTGTPELASAKTEASPAEASSTYDPQSHMGTGAADCNLQLYLRAFDTPAPDRVGMLALCADPKAILLDVLETEADTHLQRGALGQLGYFSDDPEVYDRLLATATDSDLTWNLRSAALAGLNRGQLQESDVDAVANCLSHENGPVQAQAVLILLKSPAGLPRVLSAYEAGDLHPTAARRVRDYLDK